MVWPPNSFCLSSAAIVGTNVALVQARSGHQLDVFFVSTGRWITANYAATLATNLSASCLLAYRIWYLNREASSIWMHGHLKPVVRAVIESGLIYSMTITSALIVFVRKSVGINVIWDMCSPIILITFCMIIVRIGLSSHSTLNVSVAMAGSVSVSVGSNGTGITCNCRRATINTGRDRDNVYDMKPLAEEVTHSQKAEADMDLSSKNMGTRSTMQPSDVEEGGTEKTLRGTAY
ncbi:hypothetical protein D9619_013676 [Psilocybe cf. subviscida]|uniref:Transmembrane protein n=1 Tax=Psilocybe cf. subviscida TaxID=2480587 RepID=A0A8H5AZ89_9AGAR|nr:hypothetical protein D9619_013676 [Psilocybe cf. subviscida]